MGDAITTLPSNEQAHVKSIHVGDKNVDAAQEGQPVTIQLDREVDVSRGCVLSVDSGIKTAAAVTATILWMDDDVLENGKNFFIKLGTKMIPGLVIQVRKRKYLPCIRMKLLSAKSHLRTELWQIHLHHIRHSVNSF